MIYLFSKRPDPGGFSDEELQIAARAVQDAILRSLEAESEAKHTFSESFLERMNALFRKDERRNGIKRALQHAAIIVIGVFLAGALLLAFNPEVRADFTRWVRNTYEKSIFYQAFSMDEVVNDNSNQELPNIEFTWLPGEYDINPLYNDGVRAVVMLQTSNDSLLLEYTFASESDYVEIITKDYTQETVIVDKRNADLYLGKRADIANILVWRDASGEIIYRLSSNHPKEIIIQIANGIKEK